MRRLSIWLAACAGALNVAAQPLPSCRLADRDAAAVRATIVRAAGAFAALDTPLPFDKVAINPRRPTDDRRTLSVFLVTDAPRSAVAPSGCPTRRGKHTGELDALSVPGGCVVVSAAAMEIRCSTAALAIFAGAPASDSRPALLYVLAHELAHLVQRREGEFSGRVEQLDLTRPRSEKIAALRSACDPVLVRREEEADALAVQVLAHALAAPPYRHPALSERGSVYHNIDQLALASDAWQRAAMDADAPPDARLHSAFNPTTFPTPPDEVARNARRFVCDALNTHEGAVYYPARISTHPPPDQRLRHIAEALKPVADALPNGGEQRDFQPIARLQEGLGPIFATIYREQGVYLQALQDAICTLVNSENPTAHCS